MQPRVSVILATKDRPRFLSIALRCYQHQTYPNRELIVIDDGQDFPVEPQLIESIGGRLIRLEDDTILGTKMNIGIEQASGPLCQKMDDDDWYGPSFLETMVNEFFKDQRHVCRPTMTFASPFNFFELGPWEIRRSVTNNVPGATLLFDRESWRERPFRNIPRDEDVWFFFDHLRRGTHLVPVDIGLEYLAVRHRGTVGDRGHTWTHQAGEETLEDYLRDRPLQHTYPEAFLPDWALSIYQDIQREINGA